MIDIMYEEVVNLTEASKLLPPVNGKRVHINTLHRWSTRGVRGGIRLETARIGRRLVTSREALQRFVKAVSDAPAPEPTPRMPSTKARTHAQQAHAVEQAMKRLERSGITGELADPRAKGSGHE